MQVRNLESGYCGWPPQDRQEEGRGGFCSVRWLHTRYFVEMQGRAKYEFTPLSGNNGVLSLIDELLFQRHALLAKVRMVSSSLISACASDESPLSYPSFRSFLFLALEMASDF